MNNSRNDELMDEDFILESTTLKNNFFKSLRACKKGNEMTYNNVVVGNYYFYHDLKLAYDEDYSSALELMSKETGKSIDLTPVKYQVFSVIKDGYFIPIQESTDVYEQFKPYAINASDRKDDDEVITAGYTEVDWKNIGAENVDYIYNLYLNYVKYQKENRCEKVKVKSK